MSLHAGGRISIIKSDITELDVDAIVNAANAALCGGGGVDGAIHAAAGPELLAACRTLGGARPGEAKLTAGYRLPASIIIHAVGPVWRGGARDEDALLAACYTRSLELLVEHGFKTIAFPAISTGAFRFPMERATTIALTTVAEMLGDLPAIERVTFCCFSPGDLRMYERVAQRVLHGSSG